MTKFTSLLCLLLSIISVKCFQIVPSPAKFRSHQLTLRRSVLARESSLQDTKLEEIPKEKADEVYILEEPGTGKVIECYLDCFATIDGVKYGVAFPRDWAVSIATENEDGILDPIDPDDEIMDDLYPWLAEYLKKDDIELFRTPVTLTLQGEFLEDELSEDDEDDEEWLEDEDENDGAEELKEVDPEVLKQLGIKSEGTGDIEFTEVADDLVPSHQVDEFEDEVDLIASFWYKDKEYSLLKLLDPVLLVAKYKSGNRLTLLDEEEADEVNPKIEYLMETYILDNV
eukprot:CAMPEP_0117757846 /NCGR_PEP_ID=MMETSP0947-20121206/14992_1 /TAXON_ID=44440 /ORGANISM="Chattonella subsalsa, Strain CCMP2191" /LENGTH=284 /DNA_ID=CAMNT_0005577853 /DNA_START=13 /DNA_END=867 /DNA_ORIENTATION=+